MKLTTAVVLSIDGLGARYLSPYGNTSLSMPALNRLASESLVFESAYARSPFDGPDAWHWNRLIEQTTEREIPIRLLTDCPDVASWGERMCSSVEFLELDFPSAAATETDETNLARFFDVATDRAMLMAAGEILVAHTRGLNAPWDAPYRFRESLCGEDDPPPPSEIMLAHQGDSTTLSPDEVLGWQQAYGAQLMVLDECMELLLRALDLDSNRPLTHLAFVSPRAYPIGEHGITSIDPSCLFDDAIHTPMMLRSPVRFNRRVLKLVYADHWIDWLVEAMSKSNPASESIPLLPNREAELLRIDGHKAIALRTHSWKYIKDTSGERLFFKPDDRWEMNNVSDRCPEAVAQFEQLLENMSNSPDRFVKNVEADPNAEQLVLPRLLTHGVE